MAAPFLPAFSRKDVGEEDQRKEAAPGRKQAPDGRSDRFD